MYVRGNVMSDEQIDQLDEAIKSGDVYWNGEGQLRPCVKVIRRWRERFSDGTLCEDVEPACLLDGNKYVALWNSQSRHFVRLQPVCEENNEGHETRITETKGT